MAPASMVRIALPLWILIEVVGYVAFFSLFPLVAGFLVGLASIAIGLAALRLVGWSFARGRLNLAALARSGLRGPVPRAIAGAALLLAPGFVSDFAGLILVLSALPLLTSRHRPVAAREIDLETHEWSRRPDDERGR